jgi:DNA replication licensing factor MCM4
MLAQVEDVIPQAMLKDYVAYARNNIHPELSDLAGSELVNAYLEMRKMSGNPKVISATPRQLESLIRLSEALAKMRLSIVVERKDVQCVQRSPVPS